MAQRKITVFLEVLFFQTRIFRMFCNEVKVTPTVGDALFNRYEIWKYLEEAYDVLHLNGDEYALYDFKTGLWENGPDYFRAFYESVA